MVFAENFTGHANASVHGEMGFPVLHPKKEMFTLWDQTHDTDTVTYIPLIYCCKVPR